MLLVYKNDNSHNIGIQNDTIYNISCKKWLHHNIIGMLW